MAYFSIIALFNGAGIPVFPGPDLAWQDAVIESEEFISSENSCISTSRRTLRGVGSTSRRLGRANIPIVSNRRTESEMKLVGNC